MSNALETFYLFCLIGGPMLLVMIVVVAWELISSGFFHRVSSRHDKK